MNKILIILSITVMLSCKDSKWNGEWGATIGDCDEICTIYHCVQKELMKNQKLFDKNFPDKSERRKHVTKIENGHKIESWFNQIQNSDTIRNEFSCKVYFDKVKIRYVIVDLKISECE